MLPPPARPRSSSRLMGEPAKQLPLFPRRGWRTMTPLEIVGLLLLALLAGAMWREVVWRLRKRQLEQAAISRSRSVLGGQFAEQLAPFLPDFPADPTEARFLGSPVDLVVFPASPRAIRAKLSSSKSSRATRGRPRSSGGSRRLSRRGACTGNCSASTSPAEALGTARRVVFSRAPPAPRAAGNGGKRGVKNQPLAPRRSAAFIRGLLYLRPRG